MLEVKSFVGNEVIINETDEEIEFNFFEAGSVSFFRDHNFDMLKQELLEYLTSGGTADSTVDKKFVD